MNLEEKVEYKRGGQKENRTDKDNHKYIRNYINLI